MICIRYVFWVVYALDTDTHQILHLQVSEIGRVLGTTNNEFDPP